MILHESSSGTSRSGSARCVQIDSSPYVGPVDFSALDGSAPGRLDPVSVADLLRNAFVYPPHTVFRDVKVATTGFDHDQDLARQARFHFRLQADAATGRPSSGSVPEEALVSTYHRRLCEAITRSTAEMRSCWMLQSGGKDSTSMAIGLAEARPDATCLTYLGGSEEDEVASARSVARTLGLRHEALVCDPVRAYRRYLALLPRLPLLTADFAVLSYADLATEVAGAQGDGLIDALGSDPYFGVPPSWSMRMIGYAACGLRLPPALFELPPLARNFKLCYLLGTVQMGAFERFFPGSRFTDAEVDALFGEPIAARSRERMGVFGPDLDAARDAEARRRISAAVLEASIFGKGMYVAHALSLRLAYPYCRPELSDWVFNHVPSDYLIGADGTNKVLVRRHIARHFRELPYVSTKGSFRFDVCGLAQGCFDQVHAFARQTAWLLPGAPAWLERHRASLGNKYFASKFYLLALVLPWLAARHAPATGTVVDGPAAISCAGGR